MEEALDGVPESGLPQPDNVVAARVSPETGRLLADGASGGTTEYFEIGTLPERDAAGGAMSTGRPAGGSSDGGAASTEGLF